MISYRKLNSPLSYQRTLNLLERYTKIAFVETRSTYFGNTVYHYEDGTWICVTDQTVSIWDPVRKKTGYTSGETAVKYKEILTTKGR